MTGDRPMALGRIFCRECGDHHVPGDHDEGIVLPDPPSLYWACSALHMAHMGTADPMPDTTVRQTRAFIQRKLDGWYEQRKSHEYDEAVRALCLAALKETAPVAPEELEERACYHCEAPIMVPAGSPRIHTCGKCEKSAPDLSALPSAASEGDRMPSSMTLASFREWLLLWGPVGTITWNDKDGITVPARKDDLLWLVDAVSAASDLREDLAELRQHCMETSDLLKRAESQSTCPTCERVVAPYLNAEANNYYCPLCKGGMGNDYYGSSRSDRAPSSSEQKSETPLSIAKALYDALIEFGKHKSGCASKKHPANECDCGLWSASAEAGSALGDLDFDTGTE